MENNYLDRFCAYVINPHEDGCYLSDGNGFILESDDLLDIGKNLISFAKKHKEDIIIHNKEVKAKLYNYWNDVEKEPKLKKSGHIYIMECGGKYKIGNSKNVEKRKKQLDNRPFPVSIIYKSPVIEEVYDIETMLHDVYKAKRISGEWFDLTDEDITEIKNYLEEVI